MTAPSASVAAVREVLRAHNIECTSKATGEVSCRGCRDEGWMSYTKYHEHVAAAAADAAVVAATPGIQAGALREAAVPIASALSNRLLNVGHPPETTGTVAALVQRALRGRADRIGAPDAP